MELTAVPVGRAIPADDPQAPVIGAADQQVFDCPTCRRPLVSATGRCPGCRTLVVQRTPARRAAGFALTGALVGGLLGIVGGGLAAGGSADPAGPGPNGGAGPNPVASPTEAASPVPTVEPAVPRIVTSAVGQASQVNLRLAEGGVALASALDAESFDARAVSTQLRRLASEAGYGRDLVGRLGAWAPAADLGHDLDAVYERVRATAKSGLSASVSNAGAYRDAAERMLTVLTGDLAPADARLLIFAAGRGLELPDRPALPAWTRAPAASPATEAASAAPEPAS